MSQNEGFWRFARVLYTICTIYHRDIHSLLDGGSGGGGGAGALVLIGGGGESAFIGAGGSGGVSAHLRPYLASTIADYVPVETAAVGGRGGTIAGSGLTGRNAGGDTSFGVDELDLGR